MHSEDKQALLVLMRHMRKSPATPFAPPGPVSLRLCLLGYDEGLLFIAPPGERYTLSPEGVTVIDKEPL